MALTSREKELVAVGASVAAGCKPCTSYHLKEARKTGVAEDEIRQAVADAMCVRSSATDIVRRHALEASADGREIPACGCSDPTTRIGELVSIGAAFAVNCPSNLGKHLKAGEQAGVTDDEVKAVTELAAFIKKMAASHVERLVGLNKDAAMELQATEKGTASCC